MKRRRVLRESRLAHAAVGALMLAIPASAAALAGKSSSGPAATGGVSAAAAQQTAHTEATYKVHVRRHAAGALAGQPVYVKGRLVPGLPWRRIRLQARSGRRWVTVAGTRTGSRGGFVVRYLAGGLGSERLRVLAGGGPGTPAVRAAAGTLTVYRQAVASWYDDGGGTACGFHARYGVASPSMPCGSHVSFMLGGHAVTAVVDDRGPYVSGRQWDLNQNTAGALSFDGVQTVWSSA